MKKQLPLGYRIQEFFIRNPDEELTTNDMAVKFGCNRQSCLEAAKRLGLRTRRDDGPRETSGRRPLIVSAWPVDLHSEMVDQRQVELLEEALA